MNETWRALNREAALAAGHLAIGATALSRANYAQHAYYGQAFFALTTGMERATKLIVVADHAIEHDGVFPSHQLLRGYSHRLRELLEVADDIAERRSLSGLGARLPRASIHDGIIGVLSDFANNLTRYYNLALATADPKAEQVVDPVRAWFEQVTQPVLAAHYTQRHREKHEANARIIAKMLGGNVSVLYHAETGQQLDKVEDASALTGMTEFAIPFTRMYVLQIARFLARVLAELGHAGYALREPLIPHFSEIFAIFLNDDKFLRSRKTWSIYP